MHQNSTASNCERALRVLEFCRRYGVSRSTAYKLKRDGKLQIVRIAGRAVIPVDSAEALLKAEPA